MAETNSNSESELNVVNELLNYKRQNNTIKIPKEYRFDDNNDSDDGFLYIDSNNLIKLSYKAEEKYEENEWYVSVNLIMSGKIELSEDNVKLPDGWSPAYAANKTLPYIFNARNIKSLIKEWQEETESKYHNQEKRNAFKEQLKSLNEMAEKLLATQKGG